MKDKQGGGEGKEECGWKEEMRTKEKRMKRGRNRRRKR